MTEDDQELQLDQGLKNIKAQSFHIHNTIEKNNLRQCLKETNAMLAELRTSALTPKNYYHLYTAAFDEMQYVENYFKEEIKRGRRVKDLYESVQQARFILPRMYLLITVGGIYMETQVDSCKKIIFDLLQMIKGVQNPIRGLFTRYYLLKTIKDKLPDKGNQFETEEGTMKDTTLKFILQNLEEMNRLWIRLATGCKDNEKLIREKERNELKILVGENITRLASLDGLSLEIYQEDVLKQIIAILLDSKDQLSQQYLMECIIQAFPDDYNIQCMETILDTLTQLTQGVDVKALYIALMDKLARYVGNTGKEDKTIIEAVEKIFDLLKKSIDKLIQDSSQGNLDLTKILELSVAFMKFTVNCCPQSDKLNTVNYILSIVRTNIEKKGEKLSSDTAKLVERLLMVPLESELSLFDFINFSELMVFLDIYSRTNLGLKIIESLVNGTSKEQLDSVEKVQMLLTFIKPLLEEEVEEKEAFQFEYEQSTVSKLIFVMKSTDPNVLIAIFMALKNVLVNGGVKTKKYTLPPLANALINFCYQISSSYDTRQGLIDDSKRNEIHKQYVSTLDISFIDSDETLYKFLLKSYQILNEIITAIAADSPEQAFKLYLQSATQVNSIQSSRAQFEEACASFINAGMAIYQEGKYESEIKCFMLTQVVGTLLTISILSKEFLSQLIPSLQQSAQSMVKRGDQCNAMLSVSHLYYSLLGNTDKVRECLNKAKRFADFAMTNPHNLFLFVIIMNKLLYYIENSDEDIVNKDMMEDLVEIVRNHIQTIKTENAETDFLPGIERYFEETLAIINKRKQLGVKKIYQEMMI